MSKFISELKRVSQSSPQPMGFRMVAAELPKPRMLLVGSLAEANTEGLADYLGGVDAGLVPITKPGLGVEALSKICQAVPNIPWGGWLKDASEGETKTMVEVGFDFIVFPADIPLAIIQDNKLGKIVEVEASLNGDLLKTINDLAVDAVLTRVGQEKGDLLTWHHLMLLQRCAELVTKPLLTVVPPEVSAGELQALWAAGVVGMVIESPPKGRIAELRQIISSLNFPPPSKRKKAEPLLPRLTREEKTEPEEEEPI